MSRRGVRALPLLLVLLPLAASAQPGPTEAPPEVKRALSLALTAIALREWDVAVARLHEAQRGAPRSPEILRLLAEASAAPGGRDLVAVAWYRAYLAAAPTAPDADRVREEIAYLERRVLSLIHRLVTSTRTSIEKLAAHHGEPQAILGQALASVGDAKGAIDVATDGGFLEFFDNFARIAAIATLAGARSGLPQRVSLPETHPVSGWERKLNSAVERGIAIALAASGHFDAARAGAGRIPHRKERVRALRAVARFQAIAGQLPAALRTIGDIPDSISRDYARGVVAARLAAAGDVRGADLALAAMTGNRGLRLPVMRMARAVAAARSGRVHEAMLRASEIEWPELRADTYRYLFHALAEAGDRVNAHDALWRAAREGGPTDAALRQFVTAHLIANDLQWAGMAAEQIHDAEARAAALRAVVPRPVAPEPASSPLDPVTFWVRLINRSLLESEATADFHRFLRSVQDLPAERVLARLASAADDLAAAYREVRDDAVAPREGRVRRGVIARDPEWEEWNAWDWFVYDQEDRVSDTEKPAADRREFTEPAGSPRLSAAELDDPVRLLQMPSGLRADVLASEYGQRLVGERAALVKTYEALAVAARPGSDAQTAIYRKNLALVDESRRWDQSGGDPNRPDAAGWTSWSRPLRPALSAEDREGCKFILEVLKIPCGD